MKTKAINNSFLVCCRPAVTSEFAGDRTASTRIQKSSTRELVLTCVSVPGDVVMPKIISARKQDAFHRSRPKKNHRRSLSQMVRSIVSATLHTMKARYGKVRQDPNRSALQSETSVCSRNQDPFQSSDEKSTAETCQKSPLHLVQKIRATSVFSSSLSPSSLSHSFSSSRRCCSSSSTCTSALCSGKRVGNYNSATFLFLMVVSLSVLVMWGRLCAIAWTSTCFCLCFAGGTKLGKGDEIPSRRETGGDKSVVMEGNLNV